MHTLVQQIHIRWQQYTQDNYNNTQPTNNNYTQDNLKLATIHTREIRIQHVQKVKTPKQDSTHPSERVQLSESNLQFKYCSEPHVADIFDTAAVCKRWNISTRSPSGLQMDKS